MNSAREQAYRSLILAIDAVPDRMKMKFFANPAAETDEAFNARLKTMPSYEQAVLNALRAFDALMPLERDLEAGVWETLEFVRGYQHDWLTVENTVGRKESVTTFCAELERFDIIEQWSVCREASELMDTPWDEARRKRNIVIYDGRESLVDRGVNFVVDLLAQYGARSVTSCEGHPWGAYVGFHASRNVVEALFSEFARLGWKACWDRQDSVVAYMKDVYTVAERDAEWRKLAREFNYDILPKTGLTMPSFDDNRMPR